MGGWPLVRRSRLFLKNPTEPCACRAVLTIRPRGLARVATPLQNPNIVVLAD
jgi:hypothetical protein